MQAIRKEELFKAPGVAETLDWAAALVELDAVALDPALVSDTLGVLLKVPGRHPEAAGLAGEGAPRRRARRSAGGGMTGRELPPPAGEPVAPGRCNGASFDSSPPTARPGPAAGEGRVAGALAENIAYFARALRAAGLPVGPGAVLDAIAAVEAARIGTREDFYWTLHAVFVKRHEHSRPLRPGLPHLLAPPRR